jgi:hypothetical protein
MFSRRDMMAATAVGGVVTAAAMTTANAAPVKSDTGPRGYQHIGPPQRCRHGALTPDRRDPLGYCNGRRIGARKMATAPGDARRTSAIS